GLAAAGEAEAFRENLQEMDRFLGPYPYETLKKWVSLTSFISEAAMKKLQPESGQICAFSEVLPAVAGRRRRGRGAELQFAFICFLVGNVYDAFEHWKTLLNILCRSEDAIGKYQDLYVNLISVLYHQLSEIPADFFVDIISQDNFLTSTLQVFFSCTCSAAVDGTLRNKAEKFKAHLTKKFKWDFEAEPDDCAPVVVELPEGVQVD
ncbi:PREDICTED: protein AAR2 homolog, partial [Phaethon lepturus]|uniref:protein AAR2 homolog n=1 Tax=Phaethon lepturus TaxID=97097 RepID=UPI00053050E3